MDCRFLCTPAEAMRLETERMCERSLVKTRDGMKRQLEEVNGARQREVNEARSKAAALGRYDQLKSGMIHKRVGS